MAKPSEQARLQAALPGLATHLGVGYGDRYTTACGVNGYARTRTPEKVNCRKCWGTRAFKEAPASVIQHEETKNGNDASSAVLRTPWPETRRVRQTELKFE